MKRLPTLCLALSLTLTGCNMLQPGALKPVENTTEHAMKTAPGLIDLNVKVYEYTPASVPGLTALLPQKGPRATFTIVSTSLEKLIAQQTAAGKLRLTHQMQADTLSHQVIPFAIQHYNVKRTVEGLTVREENQYADSIAMAITPFYTPGAAKIILSVDLTQTDNHSTIGFSQRLALSAGQKVLLMIPVSHDHMRLIIITPTPGTA